MLALTLAGAIFLAASLGLLARREVDLSFLAAGACSLCSLAAGIIGHTTALTALGAAGVALSVVWWGGRAGASVRGKPSAVRGKASAVLCKLSARERGAIRARLVRRMPERPVVRPEPSPSPR